MRRVDGEEMFDFARTVVSTGEFTGPVDETIAQMIAVDDDAAVDQFMARFAAFSR